MPAQTLMMQARDKLFRCRRQLVGNGERGQRRGIAGCDGGSWLEDGSLGIEALWASDVSVRSASREEGSCPGIERFSAADNGCYGGGWDKGRRVNIKGAVTAEISDKGGSIGETRWRGVLGSVHFDDELAIGYPGLKWRNGKALCHNLRMPPSRAKHQCALRYNKPLALSVAVEGIASTVIEAQLDPLALLNRQHFPQAFNRLKSYNSSLIASPNSLQNHLTCPTLKSHDSIHSTLQTPLHSRLRFTVYSLPQERFNNICIHHCYTPTLYPFTTSALPSPFSSVTSKYFADVKSGHQAIAIREETVFCVVVARG
ncbi:hypothetical protein BZA77DRAFT_374857 [Pyronema omphalodes]|nr:hypothetical protein BZA77DRAFT_374857 [Pyronema omphalodes]